MERQLETYQKIERSIIKKFRKQLWTPFIDVYKRQVSDCFEISRLVCQKFLSGEFDEIRIAFTQFVSMLTQTASILPVLPFDAPRPKPGQERESLMPVSYTHLAALEFRKKCTVDVEL